MLIILLEITLEEKKNKVIFKRMKKEKMRQYELINSNISAKWGGGRGKGKGRKENGREGMIYIVIKSIFIFCNNSELQCFFFKIQLT